MESAPSDLPARYNIAPTQPVATVVRDAESGRNQLAIMRWGLIPSWSKDVSIGSKMINARSETLADKPAFRAALNRRRCLVVADGFYEWQAQPEGPKRFPHFPRRFQGVTAGRPDLKDVDTADSGYLQEAAIPLASDTHGGEDVTIHAGGPGSALFDGVQEQHFIYHAIVEALGWNQQPAGVSERKHGEPEGEPRAQ